MDKSIIACVILPVDSGWPLVVWVSSIQNSWWTAFDRLSTRWQSSVISRLCIENLWINCLFARTYNITFTPHTPTPCIKCNSRIRAVLTLLKFQLLFISSNCLCCCCCVPWWCVKISASWRRHDKFYADRDQVSILNLLYLFHIAGVFKNTD